MGSMSHTAADAAANDRFWAERARLAGTVGVKAGNPYAPTSDRALAEAKRERRVAADAQNADSAEHVRACRDPECCDQDPRRKARHIALLTGGA